LRRFNCIGRTLVIGGTSLVSTSPSCSIQPMMPLRVELAVGDLDARQRRDMRHRLAIEGHRATKPHPSTGSG
jgi:hypothetical protein